MAINAYGDNIVTNGAISTAAPAAVNKTVLGKDDFMTLLLVQLQHQDPTAPMESGAILTQTSQLAGLEASSNTNKALEDLATSLQKAQDFGITSSIGKRADLGSDAISHEEGSTSSFEMYFAEDVASGTIEISDFEGNIVSTMNIQDQKDVNGNVLSQRDAGVYQFDWDGLGLNGSAAGSGTYRVNAKYVNAAGDPQTSRIGAYPIESVRFDNGTTFVKVGSSYVPLADIVEIY